MIEWTRSHFSFFCFVLFVVLFDLCGFLFSLFFFFFFHFFVSFLSFLSSFCSFSQFWRISHKWNECWIFQNTLQKGLKNFWNIHSLLGLMVLQKTTNRSSRCTKRGVEHVNVLLPVLSLFFTRSVSNLQSSRLIISAIRTRN